MNNGWIKLHRQFRESPYYKESNAKAVWIECLLRASHSDATVLLKRQQTLLRAGDFCMGREEFGQSIGISGSTAWYWLLRFEVDSMVDIKKTAKGSIVSVKNWVQYQVVDSIVDNKKTAEKHIQEGKEYKEVKNIHMSAEIISKEENEFRELLIIVSNLFGHEKVFTKDGLQKFNTRKQKYSAAELQKAFMNLSNEPDLWKIKNNGFRPMQWWLHSDERIESMKVCHLKKSGQGIIFAG